VPTITPSDIPTEAPTASPSGTEIIDVESVTPTIEPAATVLIVISQDTSTPVLSDNNEVNNTSVSAANTGNNQIVSIGSSQSTIATGRAVALANLVNVVNTNSNAQSSVNILFK